MSESFVLIFFLLFPDAVNILPYITHEWHRRTIFIHMHIIPMNGAFEMSIIPMFIAVDYIM